jgi:LysR family transcriptional activator of nhaA
MVPTKEKPWCDGRVKWLNYHHLYYFWSVAREGSIARAAAHLRLTEPTVSAQIHELERSLGEKLFVREGRGLVLTDAGRLAKEYADEIFALGREFQAALGGISATKPPRLVIGIDNVVPRLLAFRVLELALRRARSPILSCVSDVPERLLARLLAHEIDLVISDAPLHSTTKVPTHNRLLGDCGTTIFAASELGRKLRRGFPESLHGQPLLSAAEGTAARRALQHWLTARGIEPDIRGEFDDSALLKTFGRAGIGAFAAPTILQREIVREYRVRAIGRIDDVRHRYYLTAAGRRTPHPIVDSITEAARQRLFT